MIVGEAPGEQEAFHGRPFVGPSGWELDKMLREVGLMRSECFVTNVVRVRPPRNDIMLSAKNPGGFLSRLKKQPGEGWQWHKGVWYSSEVAEGLRLLETEIAMCQPEVIIAFGNTALWALTGNWSIKNWRGSLISTGKSTIVVPTYHPAFVLRDWSVRAYAVRDLQRATKVLREGPPTWVKNNFIINPSFDQCCSILESLLSRADSEPLHISADIESRYWEIGRGHIDCIGFAWSRQDAICIPWQSYGNPDGFWSEPEEQCLVGLCQRLLTHPNVLVSGQNWIYDSQYIWRHWRIKPNLGLDTMLAHHLLWPGTAKSLDVLSSLYCEHHLFWKEDNKEANAKQDDLERWSYNCTDVVRTWEIAEVLCREIDKAGMREQALFQHRMWHRAFQTMVRGIRMDTAAKAAWRGKLSDEETARMDWLESILGYRINPKSSKQMQDFFYAQLQIKPVLKRAEGGGPSTPTCDDEALGKIALREPLVRPIVRRISEIRSLGVFRSTFVDAPLDIDDRMRTSYNVAGTETLRFSSSANAFGSGANLQNVPVGGELADSELVLPNIRALYIPDEGCEIFDTDLSSADPRIVAAESGCAWLTECFRLGLNPYVEIAKEYYRDPTISKKHPRYRTFKELVNGTHYLGTAKGLATRIGLTVHETERAQKWYYGKNPEIAAWQERVVGELRRSHTVTNVWGYRRFFFDRIEGTVLNQAIAWIPQSSVAILINRIWDHILNTAPESVPLEILLQVHDSLTGQYPVDVAEEARTFLARACNEVLLPYPTPLHIPIAIKTSRESWGACA